MEKRICLVSLLGIILLLWGMLILSQKRMTQFMVEGEKIAVLLKTGDRTQEILPWYDEAQDLYYFFLPSCVTDRKLYFDHVVDRDIIIDDFFMRKWSYLLWEQEKIYKIREGEALFRVIFMRSENIPAFFLETDSGSMDYIHTDKSNEEKGALTVVDCDGHLEYSGGLEKVSGRGNSTWVQNKKPYAITLANEAPLCGLSIGKKWNLLALYFEHDKIHSKIVFDMAHEIGLDAPECTWIDLYCGGEYKGLYLLIESVENRIEKGRGYLIEKNAATADCRRREFFFDIDRIHF